MHAGNSRVCPVENVGMLDNWLRKTIHNPHRVLSPHIREGMTVVDIGCGPGVFSLEAAKLVGRSGKVIAVDLQDGMLEIVRKKVAETEFESRVVPHKCEENSIGISDQFDFALAFYMIHEVPDRKMLFTELKAHAKPDARVLIVEPNFHVSKREFNKYADELSGVGFAIEGYPRIFLSRSVLVRNYAN